MPASSAAAPAPAAGEQGTAAPDEESVPSALAMNGRRKSREIEALQDFLQPGTKRRRSAAAQDGALRKSKRRGIVDQRKVRYYSSRQCTAVSCEQFEVLTMASRLEMWQRHMTYYVCRDT